MPFALDDGKGTLEVDPREATLLSPGVLGGALTPEVADWVGPVFAWPKTPKHYFEQTLCPGDFVTVVGDAIDGLLEVNGRIGAGLLGTPSAEASPCALRASSVPSVSTHAVIPAARRVDRVS